MHSERRNDERTDRLQPLLHGGGELVKLDGAVVVGVDELEHLRSLVFARRRAYKRRHQLTKFIAVDGAISCACVCVCGAISSERIDTTARGFANRRRQTRQKLCATRQFELHSTKKQQHSLHILRVYLLHTQATNTKKFDKKKHSLDGDDK